MKTEKTLSFEIEFINSYGHIINSILCNYKTEKAAINKARKEKVFYPDSAWIEIICFDTHKRIYA